MPEPVFALPTTRRRLLSLFGGVMLVAVIEACQLPQASAAPTAANPRQLSCAKNGVRLGPLLGGLAVDLEELDVHLA